MPVDCFDSQPHDSGKDRNIYEKEIQGRERERHNEMGEMNRKEKDRFLK